MTDFVVVLYDLMPCLEHSVKNRKRAVRKYDYKVIDASHSSNVRTCWWTPVVREAVRLKKEASQAWLARGSPAADGHRRGKKVVVLKNSGVGEGH